MNGDLLRPHSVYPRNKQVKGGVIRDGLVLALLRVPQCHSQCQASHGDIPDLYGGQYVTRPRYRGSHVCDGTHLDNLDDVLHDGLHGDLHGVHHEVRRQSYGALVDRTHDVRALDARACCDHYRDEVVHNRSGGLADSRGSVSDRAHRSDGLVRLSHTCHEQAFRSSNHGHEGLVISKMFHDAFLG